MKNKQEKQEDKDKIYNIFKKYIDDKCIGNTMYVRAYADIVGVTFNYRYDLRNLKRGANIPLSHIVVFCSFLNEKQKNAFLGELFNA
jgi:hypothetical protein